MFDAGSKPSPKLSCRYKGPHEVVSQTRNDVECRNLISGGILTYSASDLEPFFGTKQEAFEAAQRDQEQFVVEKILSYRGDIKRRTSMTFKVKFADGDIRDLPWSRDLLCVAYDEFCTSRPYLYHLSLDKRLADSFIQQKRREPITSVDIGDTVYVDLRFFGDPWYESLNLPDWQDNSYVVEFKYTHWYHKISKAKISATFILTGQSFAFDSYLVFAWGSQKAFNQETMTLVDRSLAEDYPAILA